MRRLSRSVLLVTTPIFVATLLGAPIAGADPEDLMPYCTGSQTPTNNSCRSNPNEVSGDSSSGANPDVAIGVEPEHTPAV